jgi:drug/metabolite transporter (DMT)-like permease
LTKGAATAIGFTAVLMWGLLALFAASSGDIPPFQLNTMTFLIGGLLGAASWPFRRGAAGQLRQSWQVWLLGVGGLFGYHYVYFSAIRMAPPVEASLIAYLWPLFLVVFSALLPGEKLRLHHTIGAVLGLAGAVLIISRGSFTGLLSEFGFGHALAFACALIWSGYSILSRRFGNVSTDVVAGFCLVTAALSLMCHLSYEETVWPQSATQWLAIAGLGLMPVGAAFYTWDYGVKHGDIIVLGAASYASPLLSTMVLVAAGLAPLNWSVGLACLFITGGAILAAKDMIFRNYSSAS